MHETKSENSNFPIRALILIDWQYALSKSDPYWGGARNNPQAEAHGLRLLTHWRAKAWPVFHIRHLSKTPGSPLRHGEAGAEFIASLAPMGGEPVIDKSVNSCFIGTALEPLLKSQNLTHLVICGLTTNHCVSTSVRMAGNLGFDVILAGEACATFDRTGADGTFYPAQTVHEVSLANIHGEFCEVKSTEAILEL